MNNKPQLFCFTYAGGTADFFKVIENDLDGIEVVKLEYPGHGKRHNEKLLEDFNELADDMYIRTMRLYRGGRYAIFGYSMGSICAIEILHRIISNQKQKPNHIFLSAHEPKTRTELMGFLEDERDDWVKERTISFGDVPEKLQDNKTFWRVYLPIYRADYSLLAKYRFEDLDLKSDINATVFFSDTDTPRKDMQLWSKYFPCEFHEFSGTHFFIRDHHVQIAEIIKNKMGVVNGT